MNRRAVSAILAVAGALIAFAIIIHIPPVRAGVLRYAIRQAQERYGVQLVASGLQYNLVTLHVALTDMRAAAVGDPVPFLEADRVDIDFARSTWLGDVAFTEIAAAGAHATILRRGDGRTNLPRSSPSEGEPAALRVARLFVPAMRIDVRDESSNLLVNVPDITIDLKPTDGEVALGKPARIVHGTDATDVSRFGGNASFDGRDLHLTHLQIVATEGTAQVDGIVRLIRREAGADLRVESAIDLRQA